MGSSFWHEPIMVRFYPLQLALLAACLGAGGGLLIRTALRAIEDQPIKAIVCMILGSLSLGSIVIIR